MAQWVKTKITECVLPGEERSVPVRLVNMYHRARPPTGTGGLVEPVTAVRSKGALVPYTYMEAGSESIMTVYNASEEPIWFDPGTVLGYWTPASIVAKTQMNLEDSIAEEYDATKSHIDAGYESDLDTDKEQDSDVDEEDHSIQMSDEKVNVYRTVSKTLPNYLEKLVEESNIKKPAQKQAL